MAVGSPQYADEFAEQLSAKFGAQIDVVHGRVYDKIIHDHGVHAFVVRKTGELVKPATWKAPQKGINGLAVRYDLSDPEDARKAIMAADLYGGYLYER